MNVERRARIRLLNDLLRQQHRGGRVHLTRGVLALGVTCTLAALEAIARFKEFEADNDPYDEHDFGSVEVKGERLFWKIDYYDQSLTSHAPDASDPETCVRVMTVMLAREY